MTTNIFQTKFNHVFEIIDSLNDYLSHSYDRTHVSNDDKARNKLDFFFENQSSTLSFDNYLSDSQILLDYINNKFSNNPNYNMLYTCFAQSVFKGMPGVREFTIDNITHTVKRRKWSLVDATNYGFDKNIIKQGIKDLFSFNFLTTPENINPVQTLFSIGNLILTNINEAQRNNYFPDNEFNSLFDKEESLDIAATVFKYHPSFILSVYNFGAFQNFEDDKKFIPFFSEVWKRADNTLEDIILSSSFTSFIQPLSKKIDNMYEENFEKIFSYCLLPENRQRLKELNELLKKDDESFYEMNQSFSLTTIYEFTLKEHIDISRSGHRLFFNKHVNSEIFTENKMQKSLTVSSTLHELELSEILATKEEKTQLSHRTKI